MNEINSFQSRPQAMKFCSDFRFVYFSDLLINGKLRRELDGLVVDRVIVQLCYGYFGVILESRVLELIHLSTKDNGFYQKSYTWGGRPLDLRLHLSNLSELAPPIQWQCLS